MEKYKRNITKFSTIDARVLTSSVSLNSERFKEKKVMGDPARTLCPRKQDRQKHQEGDDRRTNNP